MPRVIKFILNPYFIFRILSFILGTVLGMEIFSEKNTFTDASSGDEASNNENIDKGKGIDINSEIQGETKEIDNQEDPNRKKGSLSSWYNDKMLKLYQQMMEHDEEILNMQQEEKEKGTENLVDNIDKDIADNRVDDTKNILELTKALNQTNISEQSPETSLSSDNKRSISEQDIENKKSKIEEKDSTLNKRSREDEEDTSETK